MADHFRYAHGINKEEALIFRMVIIHHHAIKPHGGKAARRPPRPPA